MKSLFPLEWHCISKGGTQGIERNILDCSHPSEAAAKTLDLLFKER